MTASLTFTMLGAGSSGGVPRVGGQWGDCDPAEPRNRRRRCALLIERHGAAGKTTRVLVDAGADLREQLLAQDVRELDAVLLTHAHADHIFGLDDLRQLALMLGRPIDVHMDAATSATVTKAFGYCFRQAPGSSYPPFCRERRITHPEPFGIDGPGGRLDVRTVLADHGDIDALGFRVGGLLYLPDAKRVVDAASEAGLADVEVLIVDALRRRPHPSHMSLDEALGFIEQIRPRRAILTNLHSDLDYATLGAELPDGVEAGYDGLSVTLESPRDER